jgi:hypothetical protein
MGKVFFPPTPLIAATDVVEKFAADHFYTDSFEYFKTESNREYLNFWLEKFADVHAANDFVASLNGGAANDDPFRWMAYKITFRRAESLANTKKSTDKKPKNGIKK